MSSISRTCLPVYACICKSLGLRVLEEVKFRKVLHIHEHFKVLFSFSGTGSTQLHAGVLLVSGGIDSFVIAMIYNLFV